MSSISLMLSEAKRRKSLLQMCFPMLQMFHALFDTYLYCPFSCIILCQQLCSRTFIELSLLLAMHFCLKCRATRLNPHFCCLQAARLSFLLCLSVSLTLWKSFVTFGEGNCGTAECVKKCGRFHTSNRAKMCGKRIVFSSASCQYGLV